MCCVSCVCACILVSIHKSVTEGGPVVCVNAHDIKHHAYYEHENIQGNGKTS